jgi:NAD(P) transhydrogenase subunit alpha
MKIGIPKESYPGERRVAATPSTASRLKKYGFHVTVETQAGAQASFPDQVYAESGAEICTSTERLWQEADIVLKVRPPQHHETLGKHEVELLREGTTLISFLWPAQNPPLLKHLAGRKISALAMDAIPRISRAQKMDALSSMANVAGYRAVIEAATCFGSFFTGQVTAAGKIAPAKVLIIGAGVAGLAAIGAARGLGAVVRAFDTRAAVKEQVQSLGAEYLVLDFKEAGEGQGGYAKVMSQEFIAAEMALFREQAKDVDIVITTALVPGQPAPRLWEEEVVRLMKPGSVIVDMAAEQGGNCALTRPGEVAQAHGVTILGWTDYPSRMATTSSQLYGTNLCHLLDEMGRADGFKIDMGNEIVRGALVTHQAEITWPPPRPPAAKEEAKAAAPSAAKPIAALAAPTASASDKPDAARAARLRPKAKNWVAGLFGCGIVALWLYLKLVVAPGAGTLTPSAPDPTIHFVQLLTVFVLACFVGWQVVWNVTPALHTPLMSVTNAISGIIIIGGLLQGTRETLTLPVILGAAAVFLAMINVAGGFVVTQRMLKMFHK